MDGSAPTGQFEGEYRTGVVRWFNRNLGWGFITPDGEGRELFADKLWTLPKRTLLHAGQRVRFRVHSFTTGPQAVDIIPAVDGED